MVRSRDSQPRAFLSRMPPPAISNEQPEEQPAIATTSSTHRKRSSSLVPKLSVSQSCPHLPLLAVGTSSPATITSAVAFGATTPTSEIFAGSSSSHRVQRAYTADPQRTSSRSQARRLSMSGFPWGEERSASGNRSPAAEFTGNIARRPRPITPPAQLQNISVSMFDRRGSPRSNLRLQLPPPRIDAITAQFDTARREAFGVEVPTSRQRFGHTLLGLAFPATPDVGITSQPVLYGISKDDFPRGGGGGDGHGPTTNGGPMVGGATAAAQQALLAAGAMALLTPPDDSGVLDWRNTPMAIAQSRNTTPATRPCEGPVPENRVEELSPDQNPERMATGGQQSGEATSRQGTPSPNPSQQGAPPSRQMDAPRHVTSRSGSRDKDWIENAMDSFSKSTLWFLDGRR